MRSRYNRNLQYVLQTTTLQLVGTGMVVLRVFYLTF